MSMNHVTSDLIRPSDDDDLGASNILGVNHKVSIVSLWYFQKQRKVTNNYFNECDVKPYICVLMPNVVN